MNAFEFGYAVGNLEKQAAGEIAHVVPGANPVNFRTVGNMPALVPGQGVQGSPLRDFARQGLESGKRIAGMAGRAGMTMARDVARALPGTRQLVGLAGVGGLLGGAMSERGQQVEGAGRGVGYGVGAGMGGGLGAGIGKSISRLLPQKYEAAAQLAGGTLGTVGGLLGARKMMGAPTAAKQAGMVGDMAATVKDKTKQLADKATSTAKTVANKTVDAGKKMQAGFESWRKGK